MYKEGLELKLKPEHEGQGLPTLVKVTKVEIKDSGVAVTVESEEGGYESTAEILDAFYTVKEELTAEKLPEHVVKTLDDVVALFDVYASTESPLAGIQVKTKLLELKSTVLKLSGLKPAAVPSLLGKKLS